MTEAKCVGCGCTDSRACSIDGTVCWWVRVDRVAGIGVCSECDEPEGHAKMDTALLTGRVPS